MRELFYRIYVGLLTYYANMGQRTYAFYLSRRKVDLAGADLSYLNLSGSNLTNGNLQGANLRSCDLTGVTLKGANLSGANLTNALVTPAQLDEAGSLAGATLPDGSVYVDVTA